MFVLNNVSPTTTSMLCISEVKNDVCVLFAHWRALRVTIKELCILVFYSIKRLVPFLNNGIQSRKAATGTTTDGAETIAWQKGKSHKSLKRTEQNKNCNSVILLGEGKKPLLFLRVLNTCICYLL